MISKKILVVHLALLIGYSSLAQGVGIGTATPDISAVLDITSTSKGLLIPRMNTATILALPVPANGLMVYDIQTNQLKINVGTSINPNWQPVASNTGNAWSLNGNAGINALNQFVGTTDNQPLRFRINNINAGELHPVSGNIFFGLHAGEANILGGNNIAIGRDALKFDVDCINLVAIGDSALFNNGKNSPVPGTLGVNNTAIGSKSLFSNTIGSGNTATGFKSLFSNVDGFDNTAYGLGSLLSNTSGFSNTAVGVSSLFGNTTGSANTAVGWQALDVNTTGSFNSAFGTSALNVNTIGKNNTSIGNQSLFSNTIGSENTATGSQALFSNTSGTGSTANGFQSLFSNTAGGFNTAYGSVSLRSNTEGHSNTAVGHQSLFSNITGSDNCAFGNQSLFSNTIGRLNTAMGLQSLFSNISGESNAAYGSFSLNGNTTGIGNTAVGSSSLFANTTGGVNTAIGDLALGNNTVGNSNTAVGTQSLFLNNNGISNTAVGSNALSATLSSQKNTAIGHNAAFSFNLGSNNTIIGADADVNQDGLSNVTVIGSGAIVNASNKVRIGNAAVTVIEGQVPFTTPSDGRFKYHVKEDVKGLDFILQLRPVTYQFDVKKFDEQQTDGKNDKSSITSNYIMQASYDEASSIRRTGFIAQEVEKAANASGYDFSGIIKPKTDKDHYSLSYESFVVPLVKSIQEQQQMIELLKKQNDDLIKRILALEKNK